VRPLPIPIGAPQLLIIPFSSLHLNGRRTLHAVQCPRAGAAAWPRRRGWRLAPALCSIHVRSLKRLAWSVPGAAWTGTEQGGVRSSGSANMCTGREARSCPAALYPGKPCVWLSKRPGLPGICQGHAAFRGYVPDQAKYPRQADAPDERRWRHVRAVGLLARALTYRSMVPLASSRSWMTLVA
jgi:hypothetical protein